MNNSTMQEETNIMATIKALFSERRSFLACMMLIALPMIMAANPVDAAFPYDANTVSMFSMNSPTALKRINKGYFSVLYRGFGSRKAEKIDQEELLGFHFLVDAHCLSRGIRSLITENEKSGMTSEQAFEKAKFQHSKVLQNIFSRLESTKELFENRAGKSMLAGLEGLENPETHFLFASPRIGVARMYGPIVMVIEETRPRGMDLNSIARDAKYYTVGRFLRNVADLKFKLILADYVADRDEYVIPSFIAPVDVSGLIVHSSSPVVIGNRIAVPPPAIRRVYRKHFRNGAMVIDVLDNKDRLIARLSPAVSAGVIFDSEVRSPEKLPQYILNAWESYVKSRRSKIKQ